MQVKTCGFPPLEDREKSVSTFTGIDFFGGGSLTKEETVSFEMTVTYGFFLQFRSNSS